MTRHIPRLALLAIAPVAVAVVLAGCGGGSSGTATTQTGGGSTGSSDQGQVLRLSAAADGQLRFDSAKLTAAKPGKVTLRMDNPMSAGMDHGISVEGNGVDSDGPIVAPGNTSTLTVDLKKGTYTYYCPVPGHKQAGMVGTLTVK